MQPVLLHPRSCCIGEVFEVEFSKASLNLGVARPWFGSCMSAFIVPSVPSKGSIEDLVVQQAPRAGSRVFLELLWWSRERRFLLACSQITSQYIEMNLRLPAVSRTQKQTLSPHHSCHCAQRTYFATPKTFENRDRVCSSTERTRPPR
ncbi:hypothetical protein PAXRUDRAFT_514230 [Paxillus rubicundulus Ve08.2h10]|uniref:Uncharacterized protein n=1 Tax=Paxillus rubicundulus Ve08.2h10 TaxID=930991 RepID=A0A0D0DVG3_9AGAM|nr:hypothetical protein PAXRUDRAFT_514230 [Paxillus rubicundulus Ve08.2h10]